IAPGGGNWDDEFHQWNVGSCVPNNDGPAAELDAKLNYRCCAEAPSISFAGVTVNKECPTAYTRYGAICYRNPKLSKTIYEAIQICMKEGAHVCEHTELMTICGFSANPFAGNTSGWYGDKARTDDHFGMWNQNNCLSNNDGPSIHGLTSPAVVHPFRCCRSASIPMNGLTEMPTGDNNILFLFSLKIGF
ncbi:MAG: hypothetical protein AAGM67_10705, partial [Bacteroidota bacterium]